MSTDRKIFTGFAGGIGMSAVNIVVSFLQMRILLRYLPTNLVGIWMLFVSIGGYIIFFDLGMSPTIGREISFICGSSDLSGDEQSKQIGTLIRSCTRVISWFALVVYLSGTLLGWIYLETVIPLDLRGEFRIAWYVFAAGASINLVGEGWFAGIYGMGQVLTERLIRSSGLVLGLILMVSAIALGYGIRGLALAWLLQGFITVLIAHYVLSRLTQGTHSTATIDLSIIRRMAGPSLKYACTLLGGILILQTDNLVIASVLGPGLIPNYQAISKLVTTLMSLSMMIVVTSTPFMSRAFAQHDFAEIRRLLERNLRFGLTVIVVFGSFLACFADDVVRLWIGPNRFVGFGVVWILLAVMLLEAHHLAMATATMATGQIVFVGPALIAGVLNILFSVALAHHYGLFGVALGTMCAQILTNNWYVPFYAMRQFRISFHYHLRTVLLPLITLLAFTLIWGAITRYATIGLPNAVRVFGGFVSVVSGGLVISAFIILSRTERRAVLAKVGLALVNSISSL